MNISSRVLTSFFLQISFFQDGKPDTTYFSVDCFHFSERGHADMAAAMWNNMVSLARAGILLFIYFFAIFCCSLVMYLTEIPFLNVIS